MPRLSERRQEWEEKKQTGIHKLLAMTAAHVYFLGTRHGGKLLLRRGESSTPPTKIFYPHLDVCPVLPSSEGGQMSDLLSGGLKFTGTRLSSEHLASDPASCFSNNVG